jgi:hypothetical protein
MDHDLVEQPLLDALPRDVAPKTTTSPVPAAVLARVTAATTPSVTNVPVIHSGTAAGGSWVTTKNGPLHAPP